MLMNGSINRQKESQDQNKHECKVFNIKFCIGKNIIILPSGLFTNMRAFAAATSAIPACS